MTEVDLSKKYEIDKKNISYNEIEKFYHFLMGEKPDNWCNNKHNPKLTKLKAFKIIYYLQEVLSIFPDYIEKCQSCGDLFDTGREGYISNSGSIMKCEICSST